MQLNINNYKKESKSNNIKDDVALVMPEEANSALLAKRNMFID